MQCQRKQANRQAKKQLERRLTKEQTNKESQMGANKHVKHTKGRTNMLSNKRGFPRRTNAGLDWVTIASLVWSTNNTRAIKQNS